MATKLEGGGGGGGKASLILYIFLTLVNKYCYKSSILEGFQTLMFRPDLDPTRFCNLKPDLTMFGNWNRIPPRLKSHVWIRIRNPAHAPLEFIK